MTGTEIYKRTSVYESQAKEIRLHAPQWKLLLAFDGQRSLTEVALGAEVSFADALPLTQKFLQEDWIAEQPITLEQYLKRMSTRDISAAGAAVPPPTVLHEPKAEPTPQSPPQKATAPIPASAPPPLPPTSGSPTPAPAKPVETTPTPVKPTVAKSSTRTMRLSAVVDFITSLVGNISIGQLLVYRVFLRVPPELLL